MLKGSGFEHCRLAPVVDHGCCMYFQGCPLYAGEKLIITPQIRQCSKK